MGKLSKAQASFLDFFYKYKEALRVRDNNIYYNDQLIYLRGVAVGDPYLRVNEFNRTIDDFKIIKKDWQANLVRFSIHPGAYKKNNKVLKKILQKEIKAARENNLFVIVDWHVIGFPNGWYKPQLSGRSYYSYDSNFNTAKDFWKYMAVKYRDDRGIIFELWNEPAKKGEQVDWRDIRPYLERLHDIIRSNGAKNVILAAGGHWAYDLRKIKDNSLAGENIGYAWHVYPNTAHYLSWDTALDSLNINHPIFITEWGFSTTANNTYHYSTKENFPEEFSRYLLNKKLHFTAWCWHNTWGPRMFEKNWQDTTEYGAFVKNLLNEIDSGLAFLKLKDSGTSELTQTAQARIANFIEYGLGENSINLGAGERRAVIFSYQAAFGQLPATAEDMKDVELIANGRWPKKRSAQAEEKAKAQFFNIYQREANMDNQSDNAAITIMAYGLRQRAANRNLESEKQGIIFFKDIFGYLPDTTEEWNILQAITYSGAVK